MREYTPISVVYKLPNARKLRLKTFTELSCPDPLLGVKTSKYLPLGTEIVDLGVGKRFHNEYKKKYKL